MPLCCPISRASWHQSRPLSLLVDAPQRSPAPEPRSRNPGAGCAGAGRGGRPACLGGFRVWQVARGAVTRGLGATRPGGTGLHAHQYGGYRPVACDLVGFFRPRLQDCPTKHYSSAAGKALPAIPLGIAARIGTVGTQRLAVPCLLVRSEPTDTSETDLQTRLLQRANEQLADDEALVCDRGFPLRQLQDAGIQRYVVRAPVNFTARRAALPSIKGRDASPSAARWSAPSLARTRGTPLPRRHRTATKPGSFVSDQHPCRCTRRFGTTWYAPMRSRVRRPSALYSSMIRVLTSLSS